MSYTIAESIKEELAEKIALMSHNGYSNEAQGSYFAVDTDDDDVLDTIYHRDETAQWNPWHDTAVVVSVLDCVDQDGNDFSWPSQEFSERFSEDLGNMNKEEEAAYTARMHVAEEEEEAAVIEFVLGNLLDSVEIEEVE